MMKMCWVETFTIDYTNKVGTCHVIYATEIALLPPAHISRLTSLERILGCAELL